MTLSYSGLTSGGIAGCEVPGRGNAEKDVAGSSGTVELIFDIFNWQFSYDPHVFCDLYDHNGSERVQT